LLNVDIATVMDWCKAGRLDGVQAKPHGPWWIALTPEIIAEVVQLIPDEWLDAAEHRGLYQAWLEQRLESPRKWVEEAIRARSLLV